MKNCKKVLQRPPHREFRLSVGLFLFFIVADRQVASGSRKSKQNQRKSNETQSISFGRQRVLRRHRNNPRNTPRNDKNDSSDYQHPKHKKRPVRGVSCTFLLVLGSVPSDEEPRPPEGKESERSIEYATSLSGQHFDEFVRPVEFSPQAPNNVLLSHVGVPQGHDRRT